MKRDVFIDIDTPVVRVETDRPCPRCSTQAPAQRRSDRMLAELEAWVGTAELDPDQREFLARKLHLVRELMRVGS